jgi:hypothetical protein
MRSIPVLSIVILALAAFSPALIAADKKTEKPKVTIDEAAIYYGDSSDFKKPAVVDVDKVYLKIPEYKEIRDRNMDSSNPRYLMLMRAASEKFLAAVKSAADAKGYDLVGGLGSIEIEGKTVPEITSLVISKL